MRQKTECSQRLLNEYIIRFSSCAKSFAQLLSAEFLTAGHFVQATLWLVAAKNEMKRRFSFDGVAFQNQCEDKGTARNPGFCWHISAVMLRSIMAWAICRRRIYISLIRDEPWNLSTLLKTETFFLETLFLKCRYFNGEKCAIYAELFALKSSCCKDATYHDLNINKTLQESFFYLS